MLRLSRSTALAALLVSGLAVAQNAAATPAMPTLNWNTCETGFECAAAQIDKIPATYRADYDILDFDPARVRLQQRGAVLPD